MPIPFSTTFGTLPRGIDFEKGMSQETANLYTIKAISIRGVGEDEKICVRKDEFDELPDKEKKLFKG